MSVVPHSGLIFGDSRLLSDFFDEACGMRATHALMLAPYVDEAGLGDEVVGPLWRRLVVSARLAIVVRTPAAVDIVSRAVGADAHDVQLRLNPRLHAKVFVAWRDGGRGVALVGSHNLTRAAAHVNTEAGILVRLAANADFARLFSELREFAQRVVQDSRLAVEVRGRSRTHPPPFRVP